MYAHKTSIRKHEVPPRWQEFISSVTIEIPQKWADEARAISGLQYEFWADMQRHLAGLTSIAWVITQTKTHIYEPITRVVFRADGIYKLDEDGEESDEMIVLSALEQSHVKDHVKALLTREVISFRRQWMAKREALKQEMEVSEYAY